MTELRTGMVVEVRTVRSNGATDCGPHRVALSAAELTLTPEPGAETELVLAIRYEEA